MKILFVHQNFPAQFKDLAPALAANPFNEVKALSNNQTLPPIWKGVKIHKYKIGRNSTKGMHPWVAEVETKVIRGEASFYTCMQMKEDGFTPDVIVVHPGWGESIFLKKVWPNAKLGMYCEYFYGTSGTDVGFDPEFKSNDAATECRIAIKNVNNLLNMEIADAGLSPTHWQANTFPERFRNQIQVIPDGVDTEKVKPNPEAKIRVSPQLELSRKDEIISFVSRNLEPYRGYHILMRALPEILKQRPNAHIVILGGDGTSYGIPHPTQSWKDIYFKEIREKITGDEARRIHFLGYVEYSVFLALIQTTSLHVYLTYPFVLSWSLLEAMSAGCPIVASSTTPVKEIIENNKNGKLVDFFDSKELAQSICELLENTEERKRLGANARETIIENHDLKTQCLPQQLAWVNSMLKPTNQHEETINIQNNIFQHPSKNTQQPTHLN